MSSLPATSCAQSLEQWVRASGYVHPAVHVVQDQERGIHWRTESEVDADTRILTVPHAYALSYLNALIDDAYPVFKAHRAAFTVEAIGFFYLMLQYINKSKSFWKPYLDALPPPIDDLTTPLWFDDADSKWLADTDVEHTMSKRAAIYRDYYQSGTALLSRNGVDTSQFSWDLFRWAVTMFTSRSFPSRSIAPHESKYWTTYKHGVNGQRQTVLLDMRHAKAEDLDFSVLFPVIDAGNHNLHTRVHWDYDPGRFSITILDSCSSGAEVYNNYGPKSNDELLQGYGFCIEDNPHDVILLTLKPPPGDLQVKLRATHHGYFNETGEWQADKATFRLPRVGSSTSAETLFDLLPQPLIDVLTHVLRHGHGFDTSSLHEQVKKKDQLQQRYQPHIARAIIQSLAQKLQRLTSTEPSYDPSKLRQYYARIYRVSQIDITRTWIQLLQTHIQSLVMPTASHVRLWTLEDALEDLQTVHAATVKAFLAGVEVSTNTSNLVQMISAGWEDDLWVLLVCFLWLSSRRETIKSAYLSSLATLTNEYDVDDGSTDDNDHEQAQSILEIVENAASRSQVSIWSDSGWTTALISQIGGRVFRNESFIIPLPDEHGDDQPRVVLCLPTY